MVKNVLVTGAYGLIGGDLYLHRYHPDDASWTRVGMLFSMKGTYPPWQDSTSRCAYLHDLVFDQPPATESFSAMSWKVPPKVARPPAAAARSSRKKWPSGMSTPTTRARPASS